MKEHKQKRGYPTQRTWSQHHSLHIAWGLFVSVLLASGLTMDHGSMVGTSGLAQEGHVKTELRRLHSCKSLDFFSGFQGQVKCQES